ncbi:hypothetical protein POCGH01_00123700 [Plasmodium ovale]|uniref:PIR protein n=1 Tax=Plasmodium ovale TaxID=36330 RepID=A0A1D3JD29_PLAOA|nr:hypothetical protein POCGH01_00123700 [Plasmodium ovale]
MYTLNPNSNLKNYYHLFNGNGVYSEGVNKYYFFPLQDIYSTDSEVKGILNKYQSNMGNLRNSGSCHDDFSILKGKPLEFCTYLKYSFYDKVITKNFDHEKIEELDNNCLEPSGDYCKELEEYKCTNIIKQLYELKCNGDTEVLSPEEQLEDAELGSTEFVSSSEQLGSASEELESHCYYVDLEYSFYELGYDELDLEFVALAF